MDIKVKGQRPTYLLIEMDHHLLIIGLSCYVLWSFQIAMSISLGIDTSCSI